MIGRSQIKKNDKAHFSSWITNSTRGEVAKKTDFVESNLLFFSK